MTHPKRRAPGLTPKVCVATLGKIGPRAKVALLALEAMLRSKDLELRAAAAVAIWRIERNADAVIPALCAIISDQHSYYYYENRDALECLYRISASADVKSAVSALVGIMERNLAVAAPWTTAGLSPDGARLCHKILRRLGPDTAPAIPVLIWLCGSPFMDDRNAAIKTLVAVGQPVVPVLKTLAKMPDDDPLTRDSARKALAGMR